MVMGWEVDVCMQLKADQEWVVRWNLVAMTEEEEEAVVRGFPFTVSTVTRITLGLVVVWLRSCGMH
jgi:hypothetical protein